MNDSLTDRLRSEDAFVVTHFLTVADITLCHQTWRARGAEFITEPKDHGVEIRCYMRDPDGYIIEVGQAKAG